MNKALYSSKYQNWCTPQDLFDQLNEEFNFVLDAAATDRSAKCKKYFTPKDNGLEQSWNCGGAVFCNPPYGREIGNWIKKAYKESLNGVTVVMLIPSRTDTKYFHNYIYGKSEIRFIQGRLRFIDEDGNKFDNAPFPSMIVVFRGKEERNDQNTNR